MGGLWSALTNIRPIYRQSFPPEPVFSTDQIPDLTGQVAIVTGGNAGIGKETIKVLLQRNAQVYMASRSKDKAHVAIQELKEKTGMEAIFLELDLSSLASVHKAAEEFLSKEKELHILFNNAGVSGTPKDWLTVEGYDMQFGTNVVGPFLFTKLLMPALLAGKETSPDRHARIITVSSFASYLSGLHWDTFKDSPKRRRLNSSLLYAQSKLANVIIAREFAKRYQDQGIISIPVNPGNIQTDIMRHAPPRERKMVGKVLRLYPVSYGALTQLWAGTMPEALKHNGEFIVPWARITDKCRKEAYDTKIGERLWNWLEEQVEGK